MPDHVYVFTLAGRCLRCQRTEDEHVVLLPTPDPMTECPADHSSVTSWDLTASNERVRCPICRIMVEPRLATGEAHGPVWGPGRGELGTRMKARLGFVAHRAKLQEP